MRQSAAWNYVPVVILTSSNTPTDREEAGGLGICAALPPEVAPRDPAQPHIKRNYEGYLSRQRGLNERTIYNSWGLADRFLTFCFCNEIGNPAEITPVSAVSKW
jgi:hypothetical protein